MFNYFADEKVVSSREEMIRKIEKTTKDVRKDIITMCNAVNSGHPGGSLSATDIVTTLYFAVMNLDPDNPEWKERDRFILSKGHACPVWYSALARRGYFGLEHLNTLRQTGSILQGHPDMKKTPGIDMTTGSLGNGLSIGVGKALATRVLDEDYNVYVMLGDGEIQEGAVWEGAMAAAHYGLDNICAIVDYNGLQVDGSVKDIMSIEPVTDKWRAFGWNVKEIDGHNINEILNGFEWSQKVKGPAVLIAHTIKGKGISYMENQAEWHGKAPNDKELDQGLKELNI